MRFGYFLSRIEGVYGAIRSDACACRLEYQILGCRFQLPRTKPSASLGCSSRHCGSSQHIIEGPCRVLRGAMRSLHVAVV